VAAPARAGDGHLSGSGRVAFELAHGQTIETDDPHFKETLARLGSAWPRAIRFGDLAGTEPQRLGEALIGAHAERLVDLHVHPPAAARAGERPVAAALARRQAADGRQLVTNLRHSAIRMDDDLGRQLLMRLDGSRGRAELASELGRADPSVADPRGALDAALEHLGRLSLLSA
jgi:hypothetical protein